MPPTLRSVLAQREKNRPQDVARILHAGPQRHGLLRDGAEEEDGRHGGANVQVADRVLRLTPYLKPTSRLRFTVMVPWMHTNASTLFCLGLSTARKHYPHARHWHTQRSDSKIIVSSSTRSASFARYDAICGNSVFSFATLASSSFLLEKVQ